MKTQHVRTTAALTALLTAFLAIFIILLFLARRASAAGGTYYVTPSGNDASSCTSPAQPCQTINTAIAKSTRSDTIFVASGTYTSSDSTLMMIDHNLHISGGWDNNFTTQNGLSILQGPGEDVPLTINSNGITVREDVNATVERFALQNFHARSDLPGISNAVYNAGTLILTDCTLSGNHASMDGGAIYNSGVMTVTAGKILGNFSDQRGGGIYNLYFAEMTLVDSQIEKNTANKSGGGIFNNGHLKLSNVSISGNQTVFNSIIDHNGAGMTNENGLVFITNSTVSGNKAYGSGGGIENTTGAITITNSLIFSNSATDSGGGIYTHDYSELSITNSSVDSNNSQDHGGGIYQQKSQSLHINNCTISHNSAKVGGGIATDDSFYLQNSILAKNYGITSRDCASRINSYGYNIIGEDDGCFVSSGPGDQINVDPRIEALAQYLGFIPLPGDSPAINAGNPNGCQDNSGNTITDDQRGIARMDHCDIGAFEYVPAGSPESIFPLSGMNQATFTRTPFHLALQAVLIDQDGNLVANHPVTFSAPSVGPSLTFEDPGTITTTHLTGAGGIAAAAQIVANRFSGSYEVTATFETPGDPVRFPLINRGRLFLPGTFCNYCADFYDNFSVANSGWWMGDDDQVSAGYADGEYRIVTKNPDYVYMFRSPTCEGEDYTVEVDSRWEQPGLSYGIIFGLQGAFERGYVIEINSDYQVYWLYRFDGDNVYPLTDLNFTGAINSGMLPNHIKVTRQGQNITLSINNEYFNSWQDNIITGESASALLVSQYEDTAEAIVRFDNFRLTYLRDPSAEILEPHLNTNTTAFQAQELIKELKNHRSWIGR